MNLDKNKCDTIEDDFVIYKFENSSVGTKDSSVYHKKTVIFIHLLND